MIESILIYLIKVAIGSSILFSCYQLFFKGDTFYVRNRLFLILSILLPLLIPLITIEPAVNPTLGHSGALLPGATIASTSHYVDTGITNTIHRITFIDILFYTYITGMLFMISRILVGIFNINRIQRRGKKIKYHGTIVVLTDSDLPPFSYTKKIFVPDVLYKSESSSSILKHELAHISQRHYIDIFLAELFLSLQWFNPFAWALKKAIKENHEYLADNSVATKIDSIKQYQLSLLGITCGEKTFPLAHNFNRRIIKKRIIMMNKSRTKPGVMLKTLLLIPLIAILVASLVNNSSKAVNIVQPVSNLPVSPFMTNMDPLSLDTTYFSDNSKRIIRGVFYTNIMYPKEAILKNYEHDFYLVLKIDNGEIVETSTFESPDDFSAPVIDEVKIAAFETNEATNAGKPADNKLNTIIHNETLDAAKNLEKVEIPELQGKTIEFALKMSYELYSQMGKDVVWVVVQNMPSFRGGTVDDFRQWVHQQISYPEEIADQGIKGPVFVMFVVDKDGSVTDTKIMKGLHPVLDKIALDAVKSSPKWEPGHLNSEDPVKVRYSITVKFGEQQ
ncbi:MAG: M56 family metallopeptidase [Bacteroidota bacterium]|nr:M56 family metallopeptidase [Bacteroidota bacterium]